MHQQDRSLRGGKAHGEVPLACTVAPWLADRRVEANRQQGGVAVCVSPADKRAPT